MAMGAPPVRAKPRTWGSISRAKQKVRGVRFGRPDRWEQRLPSVLQTLYLIFNEGYTATSGAALQRRDLAGEAVRLTRTVHRLLPDDGEVAGLLAFMLLTDARRDARSGPHGELIPLDEQDRGRWDKATVEEGVAMVHGPHTGLGELDALAGELQGHRADAVHGHLLERAGDPQAAPRRLRVGGRADPQPARTALPHGAGRAAEGLT
jgi:predicted RNA polymerase sigma factor